MYSYLYNLYLYLYSYHFRQYYNLKKTDFAKARTCSHRSSVAKVFAKNQNVRILPLTKVCGKTEYDRCERKMCEMVMWKSWRIGSKQQQQ